MSAQQNDDELVPTQTEGYKIGQTKTVAELAALDQEDESLQRWKASLGLNGPVGGGSKKVVPKTIFLTSPARQGDIVIDLTQGNARKEPVTIKEGVEYSVGITFVVENEIVSGLRFLQVVKRAGMTVDKTEAMLGSYGPQEQPYQKIFETEEAPSGMLARSGSYSVKTRIIDDDGNKWLDDFEWSFKLGKDW